MGAYENPITVIDTESGKIWANAINNIAQVTSNTMNSIQQRKTKQAQVEEKINVDIIKNALDNRTELNKRMANAGIHADVFFKYGMGTMDDISKLQSQIKYSTGSMEDKQYLMNLLGEKQNAISLLASLGEVLEQGKVDYFKDMGFTGDGPKPDTPNGIALVGGEETQKYHKVMRAISGIEGKLDSIYVKDRQLFGTVSGIKEDVNISEMLGYEPGVIIDMKASAQKAIDKTGIYNTETGKFDASMLDRSKSFTKTNADGTRQYDVTPYNTAAISSKILTQLQAAAESHLEDDKDYASVNATWELNAGEDNDFKLKFIDTASGGKVLDKESKIKWIEMYLKRAKTLIPNYEITNEKEIFKSTLTVADKEGSLRNVPKESTDDNKLTKSEIRTKSAIKKVENAFQDAINNYNKDTDSFNFLEGITTKEGKVSSVEVVGNKLKIYKAGKKTEMADGTTKVNQELINELNLFDTSTSDWLDLMKNYSSNQYGKNTDILLGVEDISLTPFDKPASFTGNFEQYKDNQ
tara:strand:+ start:282 stop:1850 length:1569 start_codon:yes stop_codon:yes gene_type:complete